MIRVAFLFLTLLASFHSMAMSEHERLARNYIELTSLEEKYNVSLSDVEGFELLVEDEFKAAIREIDDKFSWKQMEQFAVDKIMQEFTLEELKVTVELLSSEEGKLFIRKHNFLVDYLNQKALPTMFGGLVE